MGKAEVPPGWVYATVGDVVANDGIFTDGDWVETKDQDPNGGVRLIQLADIGDGSFLDKSSRFLTRAKAYELNCTFLTKGDLLVARMPEPLGRCCIFPLDGVEKYVTVVDVCAVRLGTSSIVPKYVMYVINSPRTRTAIEALKSGSTRKRISRGNFARVEIPLAPQNEQRRIVAKIEKLFSELNKGVENLKTARAQLKVYRQAVLKHAFEGKLTAQWREENKDKLEKPEQLLARIKQEREARYEQQLQEWKAAVKKWEEGGKPSKKPSKPKKANELPPLAESELAELPRLPDGWGWVRLGNLGVDVSDGPFGSNLKSSDYVGNGIRVIRLENIGVLEFHNEKASHITLKKYKTISKHSVTAGDIIVSSFVANGTRAVVLPDYIERAVNKADCFCIRSYGENLINSYIAMFLVTRCAYHQLGAQVHGATRPRINTTQLKNCAVPFISRNEQEQLVSELGEKLSLIKQLETDIEANLQKTATLRQSVLKKAFEGKLVPQDAHDEPASVLLDRIRTEREKAMKNNHSKKTKKRKTTA